MFDREYWITRIEESWERRSLIWLAGVRRSGKTVLCRSLEEVEYLDCELPSVRRVLDDPEGFLRSVRGCRVVLDEVHRLADPSQLLKIAADHFPDVRVVATGSSTLQATAKFRDSLTGRKEEIWLTPMIENDRRAAGGTLETRLARGGLPAFFLDEASERDVQEWLDAYWARDVQELFRLDRRSSFVRFVELVLARSGGIFEATAFAAPSEVSRTTIASYLSALEVTKIAHVVRPFSTRRSTEITHAPKVYGFDTGFVRTLRGWGELRPEDMGLLWEHYVLNEMHAHMGPADIRYWRSTKHQEVDFVIVRRGRPPLAVECKWRVDGREDLRGLKAFRRAYPEGENLVVATGIDRSFERELLPGITVRYAGIDNVVEVMKEPRAPSS
jgi:predicted AAA+ superfamily ATPase